jgi:hypothetical protein
MFVILEYVNSTDVIGLVMNEDGNTQLFEKKEKAEEYVKENCAFEYQIVEL